MILKSFKVVIILLLGLAATTLAQRQMENLTRGVVAVKQTDGRVYVSWRLFGTDPDTIAFNLYRTMDSSAPVKVNNKPIVDSTNYLDRSADTSQPLQYFIRPVLNGDDTGYRSSSKRLQ